MVFLYNIIFLFELPITTIKQLTISTEIYFDLPSMDSYSSLINEDKESFLEEMIVRRELADNFCEYEPNYDCFDGFHSWAKKTLNEHRGDEREYL